MNLNISYEEAQASIRKLLNLPVEVEIIIGRKPATPFPKNELAGIKPEYASMIRYVDNNVVVNKIGCIRTLRTSDPSGEYLGLKEAKDIVENWDLARKVFIEKNGMPKPNYNNGIGISFQ